MFLSNEFSIKKEIFYFDFWRCFMGFLCLKNTLFEHSILNPGLELKPW